MFKSEIRKRVMARIDAEIEEAENEYTEKVQDIDAETSSAISAIVATAKSNKEKALEEAVASVLG